MFDPLTKMPSLLFHVVQIKSVSYHDHFCITVMPYIPSYSVCLILIKVLTLKVDISMERCTCKFDDSESCFVW